MHSGKHIQHDNINTAAKHRDYIRTASILGHKEERYGFWLNNAFMRNGWRCKVKVSYLFEVNRKTDRHAYAEIAEITGRHISYIKRPYSSIYTTSTWPRLRVNAVLMMADAEMTGHKMNFVLCVLMRVRNFL